MLKVQHSLVKGYFAKAQRRSRLGISKKDDIGLLERQRGVQQRYVLLDFAWFYFQSIVVEPYYNKL